MQTAAAHTYSLDDVRNRLEREQFPFEGVTELGSASFRFLEPAVYAGLAIHAGSRVRENLREVMDVNREDRYREEDPFTERFIRDFPIQVVALDSRFEYDLNRPEERAIYPASELTWGLKVWTRPLTDEERAETLAKYREYHTLIDIVTEYLLRKNRYAVIFDCHSYNYQRDARIPWYDSDKPVINLGTEAVNREIFGGVIDTFLAQMKTLAVDGRHITAGENVVFRGGYVSRRLSQAHYDNLLVLAIEFRKIFMDEWSGELYDDRLEQISSHFSTVAQKIVAHPVLA